VISPRSQRGMTLVEMVIALAVSSLVLVAITGVLFGAFDLTRTWGQRIYESGAANLLPDQLQADAHRLAPCPGSPDTFQLQLCVAGSASPVIRYDTAAACSASCDLVRTYLPAGTTTVVARSLEQRPQFQVACAAPGAVTSGQLTVLGLRYPPGDGGSPRPGVLESVVVFFRAPAGACGG